jgi:hypothetical protein
VGLWGLVVAGVGTRVGAVCVGAALVAGAWAVVSSADTPAPGIGEVTPDATYEVLTVELTTPLYSAPSIAADEDAEPPVEARAAQPLTGSSFRLQDAGAALDITVEVAELDPSTYELTLATVGDGAAITPNLTEVVIPGGSVYDGDDVLVAETLSHVVPLTGDDARARLGGLADLELDLSAFGAAPVVGGWFLNEELVDVTEYSAQLEATATALAADTTRGADQTAPPTGPPAQRALEYRAQPRGLSELVAGLQGTMAGLRDADSQDEVADALTELDGIAAVEFGSETIALRFDGDATASAHVATHVTEVPQLPFSLTADAAFDLHLGGGLTLDVTDLDAQGRAPVTALDLDLAPREVTPVIDTARVGMVTVAPEVDVATDDLRFSLACDDTCDDALVPDTGGTATLSLSQLSYDAGSNAADDVVDVDLRQGGTPLTVTWDLDRWDLGTLLVTEPDTPAAATLLDALQPAVTGDEPFRAAQLHRFGQLDTRAFVLGMEWVASWLGSLEDVDALAQQLPVVGLSVGDVLALADQVGGEVQRLIDLVEGDPTSGQPTDPSAQELVGLLCELSLVDCGDDGDALPGLRITPDGITYDVELEVCQVLFGAAGGCDAAGEVDVTEAGPSIDLAASDLLGADGPLAGMEASLRAGTWSGTARAELAFTVGLDLRPDEVVKDELDVTEADYPDAGIPATDVLDAGDLCRGLAVGILPGYSPTTFASVNGHFEDAEFTDLAGCDALAWDADGTLGSVALPANPETTQPGDAAAAPVSHDVAPLEVCRAVAAKHAVDVGEFLAINGFVGDTEDELATACADRAYDQITGVDGEPFVYRLVVEDPPLPIGYRVSVRPLDDQALASARVDVTGGDLGGEVRLGFLDLALTGTVEADPRVEVAFAEDAGRLTLVDLAEAADAGVAELTTLIDTEMSGGIDVDLDLVNAIAFPVESPARFRVQGRLDELAGVVLGPERVFDDCTALGDGTGLCYELGEWTQLRSLSPIQAVRMVTGLLDRVAGAAGAGDGAYELPLVGVSMQDLVAFNRKLNGVAAAVEARDPQDLTSLQEALAAGLTSVGLPADVVRADVTEDGVFTLAVPLDHTETASYPFSFDVGFGQGGPLPVRIAPSDGGARLGAEGSVSFTPTLGIDLTASAASAELDERIFLVVDEATDPRISGDLSAEIAGDVTLGPLAVDFAGTARGAPEATVRLSSLVGDDGRVTLSTLSRTLEQGLPDGFFAWDGDLEVSGTVAGPTGPLELGWDATLQELLAGGTGSFTPDPSSWDLSGVKLDLVTLVRGTAQTSRFVGRALSRSDALDTPLPLVGDDLGKLAQVGSDLQAIATAIDDLWDEVEQEDQAFVDGLNATLAEVCDGFPAAAGTCDLGVQLYRGGDTVERMLEADRVELALDLALAYERTIDTPKLIDVPGFELDTRAPLTVQTGYRLGLTLGLDATDGFYVEGFDLDGTDATRLLELYAGADLSLDVAELDDLADADGASVGVASTTDQARRGMKVGGVTVFTLEQLDLGLRGSLGPNGTAAGFALDMPERLTLADLVNRRRTVDTIVEPRIDVDTYADVVVQTPDDIADELPVLRFPVHFAWTVDGVVGAGLELPSPYLSIGRHPDRDAGESFVAIDASGLLDGVVRPTLLELNRYNPMAKAQPVRDALNTKMPIAEQNLRSMLELALGHEPSWQLLTFLLDMADVADSIQEVEEGTTFVPLGGYQVLPRGESSTGFFYPEGMTSFWDLEADYPEIRAVRSVVQSLSKLAGGSSSFEPPAVPSVTPPEPGRWGDVDLGGSTEVEFGGPPRKAVGDLGSIVSFPVLDDPLSAATLLFGNDAAPISFIEVAPPAVDFGKSIRFKRTLFDLEVAFLEARLSVGLEGAVGVTLRVGMGYSSHGLTSGNPLNGLYLVDAYDGNRDLPFVSIGGRVGASVDGRFAVAGVASADFRGSGYIRLEGGLDLFDESVTIPKAGRGDGKFHVDEMVRVATGHHLPGVDPGHPLNAVCIFRPVVQLDAGLAFGATAKVAGVKVWSGSWAEDWRLLDESWSCPVVGRIAQLDGRRLILNAGPYARDRLVQTGVTDEAFVVRLVDGDIEVRGQGQLAGFQPMRFPLGAVDEIYGDLGGGDDHVDIGEDVPVPAVLYGGPGDDTLKGGGGDDVLDAGAGRNRIEARAGDNEIVIGADADGRQPGDDGGDLTGGEGLGSCDGTPCNTVLLGSGDDVVLGGPYPVVYEVPDGPYGDNEIDHLETGAILDLRGSTARVTGTIDLLGGRFTSDHGSLTADDPESLARLLGSRGDDRIRIVDGPFGMFVDGAGGDDTITVETNGNDRSVRVTDSGDEDGDTLIVRGTAGPDRFLLRATDTSQGPVDGPTVDGPLTSADEGVVAVLSRDYRTEVAPAPGSPSVAPGDDPVDTFEYTGRASATQEVVYDSSIGMLEVQGVAGANEFALDDVATTTRVDAGRGTGPAAEGNRIQVGQIHGWYEDEIVSPDGDQADLRRPLSPAGPVTEWEDQFRYRESIRGWLSYGVSHPTSIVGGQANDSFTVYSNAADLDLQGTGGDNTFTLRAFISNGSITATGGDGDDTFHYDFEYVSNDAVAIDGGPGLNTFVAIGTELQDGFTVTEDGVSICVPRGDAEGMDDLDPRITREPGVRALPVQPDPDADVGASGRCAIDAEAERIQRYVLYGLEGNNVFWVRGTPEGSSTYLVGGAHGSTYLFGDDGDLSAIDGTVDVVADLDNLSGDAEEALRAVDLDFPLPILRDGEVAYSPVAALIPSDAVDDDAEHAAYVDASGMPGHTGEMVADGPDEGRGVRLNGLSTGEPGEFELEERDLDGDVRSYEVLGGLGLRGLDLLRVVLGDGSDVLSIEDTHVPYEIELEDRATGGDDLVDRAFEALTEADGPTVTSRAGRTELFAGGGDDALQIDAISGPTWVELEAGDNTVGVGTGVVTAVADELEVLGGSGDDEILVDVTAGGGDGEGDALRTDLDLLRDDEDDTPTFARLTGLELPDGAHLRHDAAIELLRVATGGGDDVANVRGTLAGRTELVSPDGDDRTFVSSAAAFTPTSATPGLLGGVLADVLGDVHVDGGDGDDLLMVSRRDDPEGVADGRVTDDTLAGFAGGTATFEATGTFSQGVTVWTGGGDDRVAVDGVRRDGDPTTLAWQDRDDSGERDRTVTSLNLGAGDDNVTVAVADDHGMLVVNLEDGDDHLDGTAAERGFAVFGGDGADRIATGDGDDVVFGDWGRVEFHDGDELVGIWGVPERMDLTDGLAREPAVIASCVAQPRVDGRVVDCEDAPSDVSHERAHAGLPVDAELRNWVSAGDGDDVAFGGGGRDWLEATDGVNALVGDHGQVWRVATDDLGGERTIGMQGPFIDELVLDGPFAYRAEIRDDLGGDADVLLGGDDRDWLHGGLGDDLVDGGGGRDVIWGGDGHDVIWGGAGDDRIYGGAGDDVIDVKLRTDGTWPVGGWWPGDPLVGTDGWATLAPSVDTDQDAATHNGSDLVFGGTGADLMQADVGGAGTVPGDRLLDWYGAHNAYLVCDGAYGAGWVLRNPSPGTQAMLRELAVADGMFGIGAAGSSGERQLAMIDSGNRNPTHPLHPANHADCGAGDPVAADDGGRGRGNGR